jgi:fatty-acyl-CoA synthase
MRWSPIENALFELPGIAEAAVVGVADPRWGEVPVAAVVLRENVPPDEASIARRARRGSRVARWPKRFVFRATLPRNALGKVQKQVLIDEPANPRGGTG